MIFTADLGIAGTPAMGISFARLNCRENRHSLAIFDRKEIAPLGFVAHDCGYPLSRYTCRATRVATDFLDFIAFCRCSTGVALHPLKIMVSPPPPLYMREMGAICQIGVFTWKPCTFWVQNGFVFGLFALRFQWLWPKS